MLIVISLLFLYIIKSDFEIERYKNNMRITDVLSIDSICIPMVVNSKVELLNKMLELAVKSGKVTDPEAARKEVFERERIMSTGVGKSIALPHAKTNTVTDSVGALAILENSIDYEALDDQPVKIVMLLLGSENKVGSHLRLLSKISRLMSNDSFKSSLINCQSPQEAYDLFVKIEENENN